MKTALKLSLFYVICVAFVSMACNIMLPIATPTATLPPAVDSPLRSQIIGQWKVKNGGNWGGALLTFSEDGDFSVVGGLQEENASGSYFFTSEDTIAFRLPEYQGIITLELSGNHIKRMTVLTSDEVFGLIYSVVRVK